MKKTFLILIGLLTISSGAVAQDFFPLQVGNKWVYGFYVEQNSMQPELLGYYVTEIISDTVMESGKHYFVFNRELFGFGSIARYDSSKVYYYQNDGTEIMAFNFAADSGEQWDSGVSSLAMVYVSSIDSGVVFEDITSLIFFYVDGLVGYYYVFSKQHGLLGWGSSLENNLGYWYTEQLKGCILSDTTYGNISSVERISEDIPVGFQLHPAFPNPFNPETNIQFSIHTRTNLTLTVYDLLGRVVDVLHQGQVEPGVYQSKWRPVGLNSGVYLLRLQTPQTSRTQRLLYVK